MFGLGRMDCQMPVMDGFETTAQIRQMADRRLAGIPIVALTANTMQGDAQRCLAAGMDAFLAKPYTMAHLYAVLARWLTPADVPEPAASATEPLGGRPQEHPQTNPVNPAILTTLRGFDEAGGMGLAREVFGIFLNNAPGTIHQAQSAIDRGDAAGLGQAAHALRSGAANVGAEPLAAQLRQLETLARAGHMDQVMAGLAQVRQEYARVADALREMLQANP